MPNIVDFAQTTTEKIPEFEINLRLKKFYKHHLRYFGGDPSTFTI